MYLISHFSNIAEPAQDGLAFWDWHGRHTEGADKSTGSETLQTKGNFPSFRVLHYEDVSLAFLVADTGTEDVKTAEFCLGRTTAVNTTCRSATGKGRSRGCQTAGVLAHLEEACLEGIRFLGGGHRMRGVASAEGEWITGALLCGWGFAHLGAPYLSQLEGPGFDIPFTLSNAAEVIINEQTFRGDA
jgi:hypothetical protein